MEKLIPKCRFCEKSINIPLIRGLYSELCISNWVCNSPECQEKLKHLMEVKKALKIERMEA